VIKNIKNELILLTLLIISLFFGFKLDLGFNHYFKNLSAGLNTNYLIKFFFDITTLGDSLWYFLLAIIFIVFCFFLKKSNLLRKYSSEISDFFLRLLVYVFFSGLVTQIIKHIMGRARPNYVDLSNGENLNFFTMDSNFHSFPSGHATTIFIVCLLLASLLPNIKIFFYFLGFLIAISRVVIGSHFITDVIGGIVVSIIVYKTLNLLFAKKYNFLQPKKLGEFKNQNIFFVLIILFCFAFLLTLGPSLDLFFSSLFYIGNNNFLLQSYYLITIFFRDFGIPLLLVYLLVAPALTKFFPINRLFFGYVFKLKEIIFIWFITAFNLGLLVNILLKIFWGRARPGDILEFGGVDFFTPWFKISNACNSNCSFVSGDSSVGFSLIILYFITKNIYYTYIALISGFLIGLIRIAEGGHFLSDVLFSCILVILSSFTFYLLNKKYYDK